MLTPNAVAVKFDLPSTPEQRACSMNIDQGLKTFWSLVEYLQHAANEQQPIDRVEETVFRGLLVTGRWSLESFLQGVIQGVRPSFKLLRISPAHPTFPRVA